MSEVTVALPLHLHINTQHISICIIHADKYTIIILHVQYTDGKIKYDAQQTIMVQSSNYMDEYPNKQHDNP